MSFISTDRLKPGMILVEDVTDASGRLLLSKGQAISANHLTVFKMWGVPEVAVQQADESVSPTDPEVDPRVLRQLAEHLKLYFMDNDLAHPAVAEIFRQAVLHRSRRGGGTDAAMPAVPLSPSREPRPPQGELRRQLRHRDVKLPEIPAIIFNLNDTIADPFASSDDIARVISKSPGLSALLLRIVNSAFYGFPSRIDSVARAVTIIGSKEVSALAVGITTLEVFRDIPRSVFDMQAFTHHSLACGVLARILSASGNMRNTEQMFISGLLHDIGRLVIFKYLPQQAAGMLAARSDGFHRLYDSEKALLGFRHTDAAADLFEKWKFPVTLMQNVVYHHRPSSAPDPAKAAVIHLADIIAHSLGEGKSGEWRLPVLDSGAWDKLRFSPRTLAAVIPQAMHHLSFLMTVFQGGAS